MVSVTWLKGPADDTLHRQTVNIRNFLVLDPLTWPIDPSPPQDIPAACGDPLERQGHAIHTIHAMIHSSSVESRPPSGSAYNSAPRRRRARAMDKRRSAHRFTGRSTTTSSTVSKV